MREKQKFALRVDLRALDAFSVPCPANLQAAMVRLKIWIICGPDGFARRIVENSEGKQVSFA